MCLKDLCKPDISNKVSLITSGHMVIWFGKSGSAKLRALRALVPHVPRSLRVLVPYVSLALRALYLTCLLRKCSRVSRVLHALVTHVSFALRVPRLLVPLTLHSLLLLASHLL